MSETTGADALQQPAGAPQADAAVQPVFQIEKLYVKDASLEVPGAPQVFLEPQQPQLEVQVRNEASQIDETLFEATVTVTVTARAGEKVIFLAEAAQAGIFSVRGIPQQELEPVLAIGCPTILFPYVREVISDLVVRSGFPPVVLAPVSFEQIFLERQRQQQP